MRWERFKRAFDGLAWVMGAIGGALLITMPMWMILLGVI